MIGHRGDGPSSRRTRAAGLAAAATAALIAALLPSPVRAVDPVPPAVAVTAEPADEGSAASVSARVSSPGADAVAAEIDWGDGLPAEAVTIAQLARGVDHVYGDDGTYAVSVTVTSSDGAVGVGAVPLEISNVPPRVALTLSDVVVFPGGEYAVTRAGGRVQATARTVDSGSDDALFTWSTGAESASRADGASPDPPLSPTGAFPVSAATTQTAGFPEAGVGYVQVSVADDDGGTTDASAGVVATGVAETAFGRGWWVRQFSTARGSIGDAVVEPAVDRVTTSAYLAVVAAVSGVFDESHQAATPAQVHALLAPPRASWRERATGELLTAWLHFASGAVPWNAEVTLSSGRRVVFVDLMATAERAIESSATTETGLQALVRDLSRVQQAEPPPAPDPSPEPTPSTSAEPTPSAP